MEVEKAVDKWVELKTDDFKDDDEKNLFLAFAKECNKKYEESLIK